MNNLSAEKRRIQWELVDRGFEKWDMYEKAEAILESQNDTEIEDDWIMPSRKNLKSRIMYIEYKSERAITETKFYPYKILFLNENFYLVGENSSKKTV